MDTRGRRRGGGGEVVRGAVGAGAGAGAAAGAGGSGVGASVNETLLGGHPPDGDDDDDADDEAGGFFIAGTLRPTLNRRAASARLYEGSPLKL